MDNTPFADARIQPLKPNNRRLFEYRYKLKINGKLKAIRDDLKNRHAAADARMKAVSDIIADQMAKDAARVRKFLQSQRQDLHLARLRLVAQIEVDDNTAYPELADFRRGRPATACIGDFLAARKCGPTDLDVLLAGKGSAAKRRVRRQYQDRQRQSRWEQARAGVV